ncbi:hypothetical protein [Methylobacterium sp. J-090]|uniref:hypothetical protein n=1 Tax=Methylobacterium sp. J-090 TaxID=2836666 RepID=UPI001FBBABA3|nr:hypothetical protein [Methylobacterium sp. J-090]
MSSIAELAAVLRQVASPGIKPKELIHAVREKHPDVTKKDIVRAAFFALSDGPASNATQSDELHDFALKERGKEDEPAAKPRKAKKKKARPEPRGQNGAA